MSSQASDILCCYLRATDVRRCLLVQQLGRAERLLFGQVAGSLVGINPILWQSSRETFLPTPYGLQGDNGGLSLECRHPNKRGAAYYNAPAVISALQQSFMTISTRTARSTGRDRADSATTL